MRSKKRKMDSTGSGLGALALPLPLPLPLPLGALTGLLTVICLPARQLILQPLTSLIPMSLLLSTSPVNCDAGDHGDQEGAQSGAGWGGRGGVECRRSSARGPRQEAVAGGARQTNTPPPTTG